MSINLLDMLKDQVTGSLAKQASSFLGESEENVMSGLGSAFPALLGSVISKSSEPQGASGLMDMIGGLDKNMIGDIGSLFGGGSSSVNGLLSSGGSIVESLLGDKVGGVVNLISNISGLKSGSSSSLLKMAAPFLMGMIGKQVKGKGLSFLTDLLMGQKDHVKKALPSGLGNLLGLSGIANNISGMVSEAGSTAMDLAGSTLTEATNLAKDAADTVGDAGQKTMATAGKAAQTGLGWMKWALPLLIIGALAVWSINAGWFGGGAKNTMGEISENVSDAAESATEIAGDAVKTVGNTASAAADAVSDLAKNAFATVDEAAKAALDEVVFATNSAGSQLMNYINGGFKGEGVATFDKLTFETGSAKITGDTAEEVDNLASILKAYPNVRIDVSGYTDNQGDPEANKQLSEDRALAVKARLIGQGIDASRVNTYGYGAQSPKASNDTEEGRALNRRIEVTISK